MNIFNFTFLAISEATEMSISSENDQNPIITELLMVFVKEVDDDNLKLNIEALQQNTEELRKKIDFIVQKYKEHDQKIHRLNTYFSKLKDGEYFFILPTKDIPKEQCFQLYNYLLSLERGEDFGEVSKEIEKLFGELRSSYEVLAYNGNTKKGIGEADKSKRICRFCSKSYPEVSFKKVAHSISEALGNKKIITNEECDTCNEKFGKGIENDLILFLDFFRIFFGVKGKKGVPKLKGKNFEITNTGEIKIKLTLTDDEIKDLKHDVPRLELKSTQDITFQNIYKTLSKYALSVINRSQITDFNDTIAWINGVKNMANLPKIAMLTSNDFLSTHPSIIVYLRKNNETKLPFAVAEFRFTSLIFVYIIPGSSKDSKDFTNEEDYKYFWNFFKHYNSVHNWSFLKMNDDVPRKFVMIIDFNKKK